MRICKKPLKPSYVVPLARDLRRQSTEAESILWESIRNRKLKGLKFRRQVPFGRYIMDFYCKEKSLAIELDGGIHQDQKQYDGERDRQIQAGGISVIRIINDEILHNLDGVLLRIEQVLCKKSACLPSPVSGRGVGGEGNNK